MYAKKAITNVVAFFVLKTVMYLTLEFKIIFYFFKTTIAKKA